MWNLAHVHISDIVIVIIASADVPGPRSRAGDACLLPSTPKNCETDEDDERPDITCTLEADGENGPFVQPHPMCWQARSKVSSPVLGASIGVALRRSQHSSNAIMQATCAF